MPEEVATATQQDTPITSDPADGITGTDPAPNGSQSDRTFTQAEVDRILKERLDRERQAAKKKTADQYGDYDQLKAKAAKLQELEDAAKSDEEKRAEKYSALEAQMAEMQSQNARLAADREQALVRAAVVSAATRLEFIDPDDAWRYVDMTAIAVEADKVTGVEEALKAVAEAKDYLLRKTASPRIGPTNPGHGAASGETPEQRRGRLFGNGDTPIGSGAGGGVVWQQPGIPRKGTG